MRLFRFRCPRCRNPFAVEERALGQPVACPHCQAKIQIPASEPIPSAAAADPSGREDESLIEKNLDLPAGVAEVLGDTIQSSSSIVLGEADTNRDAVLPDPMAPLVYGSESLPPLFKGADAEVPTAEILVEDRPKTIIYKGNVIELRRLSAEEKQRRRFRRRIILLVTGATVLILYLLFKVGKL